MSKMFGKELIKILQSVRYKLDNLPNCEDVEDIVHISQELSTDIEDVESFIAYELNL